MMQGLNPAQHSAVTHALEHVLILAGAGSGKTRVLTTRMAWLIQTGQLSPRELLAVTFTNKAARQMLTRLSALLPIDVRGMWVGTFHGLCNRLLRAHHQEAGLPQAFQILDAADQLSAIKRLLKAAGADTDRFPPRDVQRQINAAKEEGLRPGDLDVQDHHEKRLAALYQAYQDQCEREGVVDFSELLLRATELLQKNQALRAHYQDRFRHILVDEFQDTNRLQYRWLMLLAGAQSSVFAVGDDDQSIYAFRGAQVGNMADFEKNHAQGRVIRLEQNYRSQGHILDAANALIAHNEGRLGKKLWTAAGPGEPLRVVEMPSDALEAQWIVDEVKALLRDGFAARQIAVLYRSNAQSRPLEHALFSARVPYRVYGGQRFFERQEVKHVLAYLRLVHHLRDDTSWMRVVNFPTRGIGARTQELLSDTARVHHLSLAESVPYVPGKAGSSLAGFVRLIQGMAEVAQDVTLPELVAHVTRHSGLEAHYQGEREGQDRLDNLQELVNAAAAFAMESGLAGLAAAQVPDGEATMSPLAAFLSHASLEAGDNQARTGEEAVQLMTIHAAKGLEFDAVFITGLEEGLFPHENSLLDAGGLEEERRLMYVAITRARKRLWLTLAQSRLLHGQTRYGLRSRFLDELPEPHLKWLTPRQMNPEHAPWRGAFRRGLGELKGDRDPLSPRSARRPVKGVVVGEQTFCIGTLVRHARFGEGAIVHLSGSGEAAMARIEFSDAGPKTLALGVAKLDILDSP